MSSALLTESLEQAHGRPHLLADSVPPQPAFAFGAVTLRRKRCSASLPSARTGFQGRAPGRTADLVPEATDLT